MSDWVLADSKKYRQYLNAFTCVPKPPKKSRGFGLVWVDDDPEPWATDVQRIARSLPVPMHDGTVVKLLINDADGVRVDAVMHFKHGPDPRIFTLKLAARSLDAECELGPSIIQCFLQTLMETAAALDLHGEVFARALVHNQNARMQRLLAEKAHWTKLPPGQIARDSDELDDDLDDWTLKIDIP